MQSKEEVPRVANPKSSISEIDSETLSTSTDIRLLISIFLDSPKTKSTSRQSLLFLERELTSFVNEKEIMLSAPHWIDYMRLVLFLFWYPTAFLIARGLQNNFFAYSLAS